MSLFDRLKKCVNKKDTEPHADHDLTVHQHDEGNIQLGFESISMVNGHAGTDVTYYAGLRQVVVDSYCMTSDGKKTENIERIPVPEDIALRHSASEILEFAKGKNITVDHVCRNRSL